MKHEFFKLTIDDNGQVACRVSFAGWEKGVKDVSPERKAALLITIGRLCHMMITGLTERVE